VLGSATGRRIILRCMTPANDPLLSALRSHRSSIRRVRYRANRTVLLSVSRDGATLNSHVCYRGAPPEIAEAVAVFVTSRRGSAGARRALAILRGWEGTDRGLEAARVQRPRRKRVATNLPETAPLREMFDGFNRDRFDGLLPDIPLRVSRRMRRSLGTIRYGPSGSRNGASASSRTVLEIAISADLLLPANRRSLEDTMLHEMAHAEAWLRHGHRGHGRSWRRVAKRVGCAPRATCRVPIVRMKSRRHP
jgi:hypothetical protein